MKRPLTVLCLLLTATAASFAAEAPPDPVVSHIPRAAVISTGIAKIGYSKRRHILEIEFIGGNIYRYLQVSPAVYRDLISADSKTRYYQLYIKGNYPSRRVRPRVTDLPPS
jgi:lysyl-tRNA synthetase class 2